MPTEMTRYVTRAVKGGAAGNTIAQRTFVKNDIIANEKTLGVATCTAGALPVGLAAEDSVQASDTPIAVAVFDGSIIEVVAGEAIAIGDAVSSDAEGKARTAVANDYIVGYANSAAAAEDEIVEVWTVVPGAKQA